MVMNGASGDDGFLADLSQYYHHQHHHCHHNDKFIDIGDNERSKW